MAVTGERVSFLYFTIIFINLLSSCVTNKKIKLIKSYTKHYPKIYKITQSEEYRLKEGDKIFLFVESTVATQTDLIDQKFRNSENSIFLINKDGYIDFPLIGKVKALGLTLGELENVVEDKIKEYIEYVTVRASLAEFTVHFLGEFKNVGSKDLKDKASLNILEALSLSGGLTDYGNTQNIKVVRKKGDEIIIFTVNPSVENIIENENFYLHPGDLLYAEPLPGRNFKNNIQYVTLFFSILSFLSLMVLNFRQYF